MRAASAAAKVCEAGLLAEHRDLHSQVTVIVRQKFGKPQPGGTKKAELLLEHGLECVELRKRVLRRLDVGADGVDACGICLVCVFRHYLFAAVRDAARHDAVQRGDPARKECWMKEVL